MEAAESGGDGDRRKKGRADQPLKGDGGGGEIEVSAENPNCFCAARGGGGGHWWLCWWSTAKGGGGLGQMCEGFSRGL